MAAGTDGGATVSGGRHRSADAAAPGALWRLRCALRGDGVVGRARGGARAAGSPPRPGVAGDEGGRGAGTRPSSLGGDTARRFGASRTAGDGPLCQASAHLVPSPDACSHRDRRAIFRKSKARNLFIYSSVSVDRREPGHYGGAPTLKLAETLGFPAACGCGALEKAMAAEQLAGAE